VKVFFFWNSTYGTNRWTAPAHPGLNSCKVSANSEIAWHYAEALRASFGAENVICLNMGDRLARAADGAVLPNVGGHVIDSATDLLIGHIGPWAEDAHDLGARYIPMVAWPNKMAWPYDRFVYHAQHQRVLDRAALVIALCGKTVWEASKSDPMLSRWIAKAEQLELGFSRDLFPQVKHTFNPPGQRGFLYLGQVSAQKGTGPMVEAFRKLGYQLYIANGEWKTGPQVGAPNIEVLGWVDNSDQALWQRLAPKVDFFLCPTLWDCQPVSPQENLSRGWPVIGTRWACIGWGNELGDDANTIEAVCKKWQNASMAEVNDLQAAQLQWMTRDLRWEPVLDRFREIIRGHLGSRT
jgi:glycosyltransferase involved in cell wall biosynthesis